MPNIEGLEKGEGFFFLLLFPFDLSRVGSPPQNVFDFLQEDVSKEAFHDKPSWVDPGNDACSSPLSQPAYSFSRLFFQLGWAFLLSLRKSLFAEETSEVHTVLCEICGTVLGNILTV